MTQSRSPEREVNYLYAQTGVSLGVARGGSESTRLGARQTRDRDVARGLWTTVEALRAVRLGVVELEFWRPSAARLSRVVDAAVAGAPRERRVSVPERVGRKLERREPAAAPPLVLHSKQQWYMRV